jgi:hypothetical protein
MPRLAFGAVYLAVGAAEFWLCAVIFACRF